MINGSSKNTTASPAYQVYTFGLPGDIPIVGDWDNTGVLRMGVFRNEQWLVDIDGDGVGNPAHDAVYNFGLPVTFQ